jgi:hypothetical protein
MIGCGEDHQVVHDLLESVTNCVSRTSDGSAIIQTPPPTVAIYVLDNGPGRYLRPGVQLRTALDELGWRGHSPAGHATDGTSDPDFGQ